MLIQIGYVSMFSSGKLIFTFSFNESKKNLICNNFYSKAFPLAGLCALANNILEIRSDAFKLVHVHQRA